MNQDWSTVMGNARKHFFDNDRQPDPSIMTTEDQGVVSDDSTIVGDDNDSKNNLSSDDDLPGGHVLPMDLDDPTLFQPNRHDDQQNNLEEPATTMNHLSPTDPQNEVFFHAGAEEPAPSTDEEDLPTSKENKDNQQGVVMEQHQEGVNDFMTSALDPRDTLKATDTNYEEGAILHAPIDMHHLFLAMPHKIIRRKQLLRFNLPWRDPTSVRLLQYDFVTTVSGIQRAVEEVSEDNDDYDWALLRALEIRGGTADEEVVYPEHVVPYLEDDDVDFDWEYWIELQKLGDFWGEVDVP
jgi:hypothetical protein